MDKLVKMHSTKILKNFLTQPNEDMVNYLDHLTISLPKDKATLNLATACIRKISNQPERERLSELYQSRYPNQICVKKMSRAVLASCGGVAESINQLTMDAASSPCKQLKGVASQFNYTFSNLRDIACSGKEDLTQSECNQLLDLWIKLDASLDKGIDTTNATKETFFSVLVSKFPEKYLKIATQYVWLWKEELWNLFPERILLEEKLFDQLKQPTIQEDLIHQELVDQLAKTLNQRQIKILLDKINSIEIPENAIIIDGSNLYQGGHFNQGMILKAEFLLQKYGLIPLFVGQHYRIKILKSYPKKRLYFEIPPKCKNCSDDTVWQLISLIHHRKFLTKDIARDHRKELSQEFYLWYQMNWIQRVGYKAHQMKLIFPPKIWKRAQIKGSKLYLPDPKQKDCWWLVNLN